MNFGQAIEALKEGKRVAREGWNGKGMWLQLVSDFDSRTERRRYSRRPFIEMKDVEHMFVPWLASQTDMLAEDWVEVVT